MSKDTCVLAVDIGGTNTRFALFDASTDSSSAFKTQSVLSRDANSFDAILSEFLASAEASNIVSACIGAAGPVVDGRIDVTNVGWKLDETALRKQIGGPVRLCNDLETTAFGMLGLPESAFLVLQQGSRGRGRGNVAVVAAGTGFGEAVLIANDRGFQPSATEAGHTGFAPRDADEIELLRFVAREQGRVCTEHIVSGPGLLRGLAFAIERSGSTAPDEVQHALASSDPNAAIVALARAGQPLCKEALDRFISCYGAAAGDAALRHLALGGVFIGGGIAPQLRTELAEPGFLAAFHDKGPYRSLVKSLYVAVCLEADPALLGAATLARELARPRPD